MTICDCALILCPNECKNGKEIVKLLRRNVYVHKRNKCPRRQYECPHCRESGEYQERTTTHLEECPKMKIPCPNDGCEEEIERCEISQHRQRCLFELVPCIYTNIGCKKKFLRKNMEEHKNDIQRHLKMAISTVCQQEVTIKTLEDKVAQQQATPMKFKITGFDELKTSNEIVYSPGFYTSPGGYKMHIRVDTNGWGDGKGTHVSVAAKIMRGENDDHLPWPFTGTVTFELLNQLEDDNHDYGELTFLANEQYSQRVVNEERASSGYGIPDYIPHADLGYNEAENCQYLKDDCLYFRVKVDAQTTSKPWLV